MQHRKFSGPLIPLSLIALFYFTSILLYFILPPYTRGYVFRYPVNTGESNGFERRDVPSRVNLEEQIDIYLNELFTGPVTLALSPTVPRGTKLNHVAMIGKSIYIDLDLRMLSAISQLSFPFDTALENIRFNLLFNFPRLKDVVFTIEGQQVNAIPFFQKKVEKK